MFGKKIKYETNERVKLKSIFGIRPGVIILASLILLFSLLFFLLFMLPGLYSNGAYVSFNLNTVNTAIYMDGSYIGSTEGSIYFLPSGNHTFSFFINNSEAGSVDKKIPRRVFFTAFIHRIYDIDYQVQYSEEIEKAIKEDFISSVYEESRIINHDSITHYRKIFTPLALNAESLSFNADEEFIYASLFVTSKEMYDDYKEAASILGLQVNTNLAYMYGDLTYHRMGLLLENPTVIAEKSDSFFSYGSYRIRMGYDTPMSFPEINEHLIFVEVQPFLIASHPVTESEYALFVSENPFWAQSNLDNLLKEKLVDENYLRGITLSTSINSSRPIRSISYYAAIAYTEWLSKKTGKNITLPSEKEWYTAALSAKDKRYASSLTEIDNDDTSPSFMLGKVWEMTETPFVPLAKVEDYEGTIAKAKQFSDPDIILKGGSYIDDDVDIDSVAVIEKSKTSPFVGFRVAVR